MSKGKIKGIVFRLLLPWKEGIIIWPIDKGHDPLSNVSFFQWLAFQVRIFHDKPVIVPETVPVAGTGGSAVAVGDGSVAVGGAGGDVIVQAPEVK